MIYATEINIITINKITINIITINCRKTVFMQQTHSFIWNSKSNQKPSYRWFILPKDTRITINKMKNYLKQKSLKWQIHVFKCSLNHCYQWIKFVYFFLCHCIVMLISKTSAGILNLNFTLEQHPNFESMKKANIQICSFKFKSQDYSKIYKCLFLNCEFLNYFTGISLQNLWI